MTTGTNHSEDLRKSEKGKAANKFNSVIRIRKAIAIYLVVSALIAIGLINTGDNEISNDILSMPLIAALLGATFAGGVGLFLDKTWGHWTAVTVLSLQLVKIQFDGFTYDVLSLFGIYVHAAGNISIGISAAFDPRFDFSIGTSAPFWFGVNIFIALLITYLLTAKVTDD